MLAHKLRGVPSENCERTPAGVRVCQHQHVGDLVGTLFFSVKLLGTQHLGLHTLSLMFLCEYFPHGTDEETKGQRRGGTGPG